MNIEVGDIVELKNGLVGIITEIRSNDFYKFCYITVEYEESEHYKNFYNILTINYKKIKNTLLGFIENEKKLKQIFLNEKESDK
jgi:uncharacterized protein YkvS